VDDILEKLRGGDRRSIGRANEVVEDVLCDPGLFAALFKGLDSDDPVIRMRAADAVEKVTAQRPEILAPYKTELIARVAEIDQQEVRWHVAQMLPRLELSTAEQARTVEILLGYLQDDSRIVQVNALQALADLAMADEALRTRVVQIAAEFVRTGSPAVASRARRLLTQLHPEP
jgi:HEAT repeat protein